MKKINLFTIFILTNFVSEKAFAQTDTIFTKGNQQILCRKIKETVEEYKFTYTNAKNEKTKSSILKYLVDSVKYFVPVFDSTANEKNTRKRKKKDTPIVNQDETAKEKPWHKAIAFGINVGNILEFNNPSGTDIKNFSLNTSLDLGLNYRKQGKKFEMTNELHYQFGIQKEGLISGKHLQRVQDDLAMLHDVSVGIGKNNKWNFNLIVKSATSLFTIFDGEYFKDYNTLGRIKNFASPYDVTVSPGIKFQPNQYFRISLSPYSFNLYGIRNRQITSKGIFITDLDAAGNYKNFLFKRLGAEVNFWYDRQIKQWLEMQYRLSFSSDYFEKIGKNGLMDGLLITKLKIIKDIYLTHRATLKGDFAARPFKPYYNQSILLSYSKSF